METTLEKKEVSFVNDLPEKKLEYQKIIDEKKAQYSALIISGIEDKEGYKAVDTARKDVKAIRVGVEKYCKNLRDEATKFSKSVIAEENKIVSSIEEIESSLQAKTDAIDAEKEKIRLEKENAEKARIQARVDALKQYNVIPDAIYIMSISDEIFEQELEKAKTEFETEQKRHAEIEAERLAEIEKNKQIAIENERKSKELLEAAQKLADQQAEIDRQNRQLLEAKKENRINQLTAIGMRVNAGVLVYEDMKMTTDEIMF